MNPSEVAPPANTPAHPKRLYFKTYLQAVHNAVGTQLFRNFYLQQPDGTEIDGTEDGENSCAFFVSSVLTIFKKVQGVHGTVVRTVQDLQASGWEEIAKGAVQPGDVIVWAAQQSEDAWHGHIGFYIGDGRAVSTSSSKKMVAEHDAGFDGDRPIVQVFRNTHWDS
jgi:hypothetical protein